MAAPEIDIAGLTNLLTGRAAGGGRVIAAVAGAPGSGKSTMADMVAHRMNLLVPGQAAVLRMDAFHYDDLYLLPEGLRPRKGAPDTFDVGGLRHMLLRLRARDEPLVFVPLFDRDIEIARAGALPIAAEIPVIIVEGNYLLLGLEPWASLRPLFDVTVLVTVPEQVLRARLTERWQHYNLTPEEIDWKLDGNDLPNGRLIMAQSGGEDYRMPNG